MRRVVVAWIVGCGCGRLGFEPLDGGPAQSCSPEVCNGIDDDCDGIVDEGCPCTPFDISLTQTETASGLVWTGDGCFVLTTDGTTAYVERLDGAGISVSKTPIGDRSTITFTLTEISAWTGSELGLVWARADGHVQLARFDATGSAIGSPVDVNSSTTGITPVVFWNRDRFAIAWVDAGQIFVRELAADATPLTPELPTGVVNSVDWIAPTAMGYVMAAGNQSVEAPSEIVVDRAGKLLASRVLDPGATSQGNLEIVPGPGGFAATWSGGTTPGVSFVAMDAAGTPTSAVIALPSIGGGAGNSAAAAIPGGYAVYAQHGSFPQALAYVEVDASGNVIAGPVMFGTTNGDIFYSSQLVTAAGRAIFALPIISPMQQLRVIQQCR